MSYTYSYQTSMTAGVRVYDKKLKKVGAIQSVSYYDPVTYYQRLYGSWPIRNFDQITVRFDGDGSDTIYRGEPCGTLELESATTGSAYSKLVLWHDFEETAGTVIGDWKNNVHSENKPASAVATKSTSSAVGDRCLVFNGSSQYTLGGVTNMPTTKMSFAFWIKTTDTAGTLVSFGGGASNNVERAVKLSAGKVQLFEKNGGAETSLLSSGTVNDDSWHHIVCTIAGISSAWKIYVDKIDVSASAVNGPGNSNLAVTQTTIAVSYLNAAISNYYAGSIDDLRVYNEVLSTAEITELYDLRIVTYPIIGQWYLLFRQTVPYLWPTVSPGDTTLNSGDTNNNNYSILPSITDFKNTDGKYRLKYVDPANNNMNDFRITSNMTSETQAGLEDISIHSSANGWGGLGPSTATGKAHMDGSPGFGWWFSVGAKVLYSGAYAGLGYTQNVAEVWAMKEN